jgi:hypothetical protein
MLAAVITASSARAANAATINVPGDQPTIQAAITAASSGDTINVAAGTYVEVGQIVINKSLSIVGADKATTIVKPAQDTGNSGSGDYRGWFLTGSGITFNMSGVTLDGAGKNICHGIYDYSLGTIEDINVKNIGCEQYYGRGIYLKNNATVRSVKFENIARIGVFIWQGATAAVIDGNTYLGKGAGDHLDYGIEVENGGVATITNNTISNNTGLTLAGEDSAGILVTTYYGGGSQATITGNTITGNTGAIVAGYCVGIDNPVGSGCTGPDTSVVTAHFNRITGNGTGIASAAPFVDAENNWWGCNYGPGAGGAGCPGATNGTNGTVDSNPWLKLTTAASPSSGLTIGDSSTVTSKLTTNSDNVDTSGSGNVPNGILASFTPTGGTLSSPTDTTTSGVTDTTFTATTFGIGGVSTLIDGQTVNAPIDVNSPCINVSIPNVTSLTGVQVTVPVYTNNMSGRGALSADFTITYNAAVLTPLADSTHGVTPGSIGTSNGGGRVLTVSNPSAGTLIISVFGANEFQGGGDLVDLNFNVIGLPATSSALNLTSFQYNEGAPCSGTTNGSVTVIGGTITGTVTYGNALVGPTPPRYVPGVIVSGAGSPPVSSAPSNSLGAYSLSGFGPGLYTRSASKTGGLGLGFDNGAISGFDAAKIAQSVVGSYTLTGNQPIVADVSGNGTVTSFDAALIARYRVSLPGSGSTGNWIFQPVSYGPSTVYANISGENYVALLMGDVTGNWNDPTSETGGRPAMVVMEGKPLAISASKITAESGTEVSVPVSIGDTTNKGIVSYQFDLKYDPAVLEPVADPVDIADTVSNGLVATVNSTVPGVLRVVVFGAKPLEGKGQLLNLRFNVIGPVDAATDLHWENFGINEGDVYFSAADGRVEVTSAAKDATINGHVLTQMGRGIPSALVTVTDTLGKQHSVLTGKLGNFQIGGLELGQTYNIAVSAGKHRFAVQTISLVDSAVAVDLIAEN